MALSRKFCLSLGKHAEAIGFYKRVTELATQSNVALVQRCFSSATQEENKIELLTPSDTACSSAMSSKTNSVQVGPKTNQQL